MPIERFLADAERGRDRVHTHRFNPLGMEQAIHPRQDPLSDRRPSFSLVIGNLPVPGKRQSTQICRVLGQNIKGHVHWTETILYPHPRICLRADRPG